MILRQTTSVVISFGPFVDKADGVTLKTGLVSALDHATTGILLSKNGGTMAVRSATVTASVYDAHGCYKVTLSTTDTGTLGSLRVIYTDATTCLPVWQDFQVVTANEWDSQCAAAIRAVNTTQISGTAQTARDIGASVLLSNGTGTGQLSLTAGLVTLAGVTHTNARIPNVTLADTVTTVTNKTGFSLSTAPPTTAQITNAVWDEATNAHTGAGSLGKALGVVPTTVQITNAIWDENTSGHTSANTMGKIQGLCLIDKAGFSLSATGLDTIAQSATGVIEIAKAIWDRLLTSATHNIVNSAGRAIRAASGSIAGGTAQSGTASTIVLASAESSVDGTFDPAVVRIMSGAGAGQSRLIIQYVGATRTAHVDRDWRVNPDNTSVYEIISAYNIISSNEGVAQGGAASTITLNAQASAVNDFYVGQTIALRTSTGQDQSRVITAYVGSTKVATVAPAWQTAPVAGTGYIMWPLGPPTIAQITSAVWDEPTAGHQTAGTTGKALTSASAAGDPWSTALPGAYVAGSAGKIVGDNLNATVASRSTLSAAEAADAVWDEATSGHTAAGTTGKALLDAGSAGDPWGTPLPGAYGAGTAGKILGDNLNVTVSSRSSHTAADVWAAGSRTLTSFGTLVADVATAIWGAVTRTLTDKTGFSLAVNPPTATQIRQEMDTNSTKLDATVSSRSTYAGADTPGTTTLLARVTSTRAANLDFLDSLISAIPVNVWAAASRTLTSFGSAAADAATAVWGAAARTLTAFGFSVTAANALTAPQTANAVWDEPATSHAAAGSTGAALTADGSGGSADPVAIAETLLKLDWSTVTGEADRSVLSALRSLRNRVSILDNGDGTGTITVTKENDATVAWTAQCVFDNNGRSISGVDPA